MGQTFPERRWKVGDLCKQNYYGLYLIIGVVTGIYNAYDIITEHGQQYQLQTPEGFEHSTGLVYAFEDYKKAKSDFEAGFFTPYFEIL